MKVLASLLPAPSLAQARSGFRRLVVGDMSIISYLAFTPNIHPVGQGAGCLAE